MTKTCWIAALALVALAPAHAATVAPARCGGSNGYPTFCAIPPTPTHVRSPQAFKAAVVDTRLEGARLVRDSAPSTFTLSSDDTEAFDRAARNEAAYPTDAGAPATDTGDFAAAARRLVTPPPRPRP